MVEATRLECDGCGSVKNLERFTVTNKHKTEWFVDLCPKCAEPVNRGKGVNHVVPSRYNRFKVTRLPKAKG